MASVSGRREWAKIEAEIIPRVSGNFGQSLSHGLWPCQLPLHKGALVLREDVPPIEAGALTGGLWRGAERSRPSLVLPP